MKLILTVLFLTLHTAAAQQARPPLGKPESPRKLVLRPVPGMTAPAQPAELSSSKAAPQPAGTNPSETSLPARILFIHRRGSFRLPDKAIEIKVTNVEGTVGGQLVPRPLAEGKVRIIPGLRGGARASLLVSPTPLAGLEPKATPTKANSDVP